MLESTGYVNIFFFQLIYLLIHYYCSVYAYFMPYLSPSLKNQSELLNIEHKNICHYCFKG